MYIIYRDHTKQNPTTLSAVGFNDGAPHADTPMWADEDITTYILFGDADIWDGGGTITSDNVSYTAVPADADIIPLVCLMEAA